ncbi:MAG: 4Fe-4S dicluster domain-containing protein [Acidobacteriota bacterium]
MLRAQADPEFPPGVDEPPNELDRRDLMKLLAASIAFAGTGCMKRPQKRIMPRVEQPPELTPGVPLQYATSMTIDGYATGLVVTTNEARPTKVEGNPDHPASLGATTALHQASVLQLYDPYRATGALRDGAPIELGTVARTFADRAPIPGLWFLLQPQSSPLVEAQIARIRARHPTAHFAFYSPVGRRTAHEGAQLAFGRPLEVQYHFDRADVVVALDADFMCTMPNSVRWSRDFAARRRPSSQHAEPSRLYAAEPRPTPTGSLADHRLPARPSELHALAVALLAAIEGRALPPLADRQHRWVLAAAADLSGRRGRALLVVGDRQPKEIHAIGHVINDAIGAFGATADLTRSALIEPLGAGMSELVAALRARTVQTLVIAEANPLYAAPAEPKLAELFATVPDTVSAGFSADETSRRCRWFVPLVHYMEGWGDARAYDGTVSFVQPMIQPLQAGWSLVELLEVFAGNPEPDGHALLLDRYQRAQDDAGIAAWQTQLQRGLVLDTAFPAEQATIAAAARTAGDRFAGPIAAPIATRGAIELSFDVSPAVHDGRFATITWLQELPRPMDKITWGNAAMMSEATASALGVATNDVVRITAAGSTIELPAYVQPGHADACISLELGYGRWGGGPIADGVGANVYRVVPVATPWSAVAKVEPTGAVHELAQTQQHWQLHDREIVFDATVDEYRRDPEFTRDRWREEPSMLPPVFPGVPKWGMTIDTTICSGCSACVIACMAENNVPVVGATGVIHNREMHWLRIDTYRKDKGEDVAFVHQPMLCQHCEDAPCEYVCPVYATQHSPDGLNEMIYNRCIGTRFCSNNCPYKVRRFNWFDFTENTPETLQLQFNPNVTVRGRGVMEKCSYCVQRIRAAEIAARRDKRDIRPGEVVTACQQACPTGAIQFGRLDHEQTTNVQWRREPRHYGVLSDLGTRPKTVYLAKIWNPKPGYEP